MKIRILGSGTSSGVPRIGNDWGACDPTDSRNRRTRASVLVSTESTRILVDTSPDMREQLLAADISAVDAVIWTHDHADHCHGLDDLRQLFHARGAPVTAYARPATAATLRERFRYAFEGRDGYPPVADLHNLPDQVTIGDIQVSVVEQPHGSITSAGLHFVNNGRSIAYSTDFNILTDEMRALYHGLDLWVVDALRRKPHPTHPNLDEVLRWIRELGASRAALVHMDLSMDYARLAAELPPNVEPGYDGLEIAA